MLTAPMCRSAVASAAAAAKAAQRSHATKPAPPSVSVPKQNTQTISPPSHTAPATQSSHVATSKPPAPLAEAMKPERSAAPVKNEPQVAARSTSQSGEYAPAAAVPDVQHNGVTAVAAPVPDREASTQRSSSGSDSSYVLVDAPSSDSTCMPVGHTTKPAVPSSERNAGRDVAAAAQPSSVAPTGRTFGGQKAGDQSKADIMRVKGIEAWKAGDVPRALGLWSQAAQVAPGDYRVHLNISQVWPAHCTYVQASLTTIYCRYRPYCQSIWGSRLKQPGVKVAPISRLSGLPCRKRCLPCSW